MDRSHTVGHSRFGARLLLALALGLVLALPGGLDALAAGQAPRLPAAPSSDIVSPASASGPVGTTIEARGQGWTPGVTLKLFYNSPDCGAPANAQNLSQTQPLVVTNPPLVTDQSGNWKADFQWPFTSTGNFAVCAFDTTPANPTPVTQTSHPFNVLSTAVPTIDHHMQSFPTQGDKITIFGSGFLPGNQVIDLKLATSLANQSQAVALGTATADGGGAFAADVTLPPAMSGNLTIFAASRPPQAASSAPSPLFASIDITIEAATATPTPSPTTTATPDPTVPPTAVPTSVVAPVTTKSSGAGGTVLTLLVVLLVLVILAIFGVLIWYFAGIRPPPGAAPYTAPPPQRPRAPAAPRGNLRSRYSRPPEEDEWEEQQGPWEEDTQGSWSSGEWGNGSGQQERRGAPPRQGRMGPPPPGTRPADPARPPRATGPRQDWQGRNGSDEEEW